MIAGGWGNRWMFARIPSDMLDDNGEPVANGSWIHIECHFCRVWLRIGRCVILHRIWYWRKS